MGSIVLFQKKNFFEIPLENMVIFQQRIIWEELFKVAIYEMTLTGERSDILTFIEPFDTQPKINLFDHSFLHLDHNFL